jgi:hypothetical protein
MIWLLMVITLNLSVTPIQIQFGEIIETFPNEQECVERQAKFFNDAKREKRPIPANFNLGCVPLKRSIM